MNGMSEAISEKSITGERVGGVSIERAVGSWLLHTFCMII